jgi:hypothetical protein
VPVDIATRETYTVCADGQKNGKWRKRRKIYESSRTAALIVVPARTGYDMADQMNRVTEAGSCCGAKLAFPVNRIAVYLSASKLLVNLFAFESISFSRAAAYFSGAIAQYCL